jgi:hypothetical protein
VADSTATNTEIIDDDVTTNSGTSTTNSTYVQFRTIDPIYALPTDICQQLQLPGQVMVSRKTMNDTSSHSAPVLDERLNHYNKYYCD